MDWRILSGEPSQARLFQLVNQKAGFLIEKPPNTIVDTYFPRDIQIGGKTRPPTWMDVYKFLLDLTRHTPRDLLRLFEYIRRVADAGNMPLGRDGRLTGEIIKEGANQYVMKYFVDAIQNELVGRRSDDDLTQKALSALRHLPRRAFTVDDFTQECFGDRSVDNRMKAEQVLTWLFYAGALGNGIADRSEFYLQYYHRREEAEIHLKGKLVLHNALARAWNIHW